MSDESVDILVVDDDPWIVELVVMAAEERNWSVVSAGDGPTGIETLARRRPRLMLLDVRLPRQNGWAVLADLGQRMPDHPPVIMMTANQVEEEDGELHGAVAVLRKPFSVYAFLDLLGQYLQ